MDTKKVGNYTKMVHSGNIEDKFMSATVPIYQTSTFAFHNADHGADLFNGKGEGYIYTRLGNPTIEALENAVTDLENGYGGIATSSGMSAVTTLYTAMLGQGDHMVGHNAIYGPSRAVMENIFSKFGIEYSFVDTTNPEEVRHAIKANTKLVYTETPANPTMGITDIQKIADIAHEHNIPLCVDNTFCSPHLQKPLEIGADIVLHSMTKFINGHADIVAGMLVAKTEEHYKLLRNTLVNMGGNMDPHQAYMVHRGLKTLGIRIDKAQKTAMAVASFLENHPKVDWVKYPGLESHPQHDLAKKQMDGFGTMISFGLKGGYDAGKTMMNSVQLALLAVSLGGVETLIQHPASMTHSKLAPEDREKAGISEGLVRFAVGIEDEKDIIHDLEQALENI
ncbi:MAG: aminotransferase class I/II-fold pyridoxal phosphate-dependent enzyme [Bacteroidales bacterium]